MTGATGAGNPAPPVAARAAAGYGDAAMRFWVACVLSAGCSLSASTPQARVRRGPAFAQPPSLLLALPAECISAEGEACTAAHRGAVDSAARMALELVGYSLVDSELVNVRLGERRELTRESSSSGVSTEEHEVAVTRVSWVDATLEERRAVIDELEVDGLLSSAITMSRADLVGDRSVEVRVTLSRVGDDEIVWASRCRVETGDGDLSTAQAVEHATRCALESATLLD